MYHKPKGVSKMGLSRVSKKKEKRYKKYQRKAKVRTLQAYIGEDGKIRIPKFRTPKSNKPDVKILYRFEDLVEQYKRIFYKLFNSFGIPHQERDDLEQKIWLRIS